MAAKSSESGFDELMRLSQQFKRQEREATHREQQSARQRKKTQDVLSELRGFSISVAIGQLEMIADPGMVEKVDALRSKRGTAELRGLIRNLAYDLEKRIRTVAAADPDIKPIESSIKTLAILMELLFSLE
ncbi:hypothetical protein ACFLVQ_01270 [Chloroflexota bacterium]